MSSEEHISPIGHSLLNRRSFMKNSGFSLGALGLAQLLSKDGLLAASDPTSFTGKSPIRPKIDPDNPYASRDAHFNPPAKQVLVIFCPGAVSHVDTFDYKPDLTKYHGQKPPGIPAVTLRDHPEILLNPSGTLSPEEDPEKWCQIWSRVWAKWQMTFVFFMRSIPRRVHILRVKTF